MLPLRITWILRMMLVLSLAASGLLSPASAAFAPLAPDDPIPSSILDPNSVGWASVRNMTSSQYSAYFDEQARAGLMVIDIEVDEINGVQRVGATWQRNTDNRGWAQLRNMTADEFGIEQSAKRGAGYRLIDQEHYLLGSQKYFAAVWIENKERLDWISYVGKTSDEFGTLFTRYSDSGYMMIDIDAEFLDGALKYSAVWVDNSENLDWIEWRDLTSAQFAEKFDEYKDTYRMIDVESYQLGPAQLYAGIWVENRNGRGWVELRDMTAKTFGDEWLKLRDAGYRLVDYETYPTNNGQRYAGIWRQNSERPNWPLKAEVDTLGLIEQVTTGVPGMSIAIAQDGQFVYLRGFGYADVDDNIIAHSGTIFRLASVSKAVAGVLSLEVEEKGLVDLSDPAFNYIPGLPNSHTYSISQTISNRSGIGHYATYGNLNGSFNTAYGAAVFLWPIPLNASPGSQYIYSTHAYTFLGAALEGAVGDPIGTIFEDYLREPFNLGTLTLENRAIPNKFRATLYDTDNDEVEADNLSWKVLGGGLEASAYDLARFGIQVQSGAILETPAMGNLWTPPDGLANYALGWITGTHKGVRVVAKDGLQNGARSYIRVYPDDGIVIVVLTNRRDGGHDPGGLAKTIGGLMLDAAVAQSAAGSPVQALAEIIEEPADEAQDPAEVAFPAHNPTASPTAQDLEEPIGWPFVAETVFLPFLWRP